MCVPYLYCDRRKWFWLRFVWLIRKPQVFRIYNGTSVPFETMGERVNSSRDVVAHWTGMSGDVRQLQRFPMSGFQVTPLVCDATWGVGHKSISCSEEWRIRRQGLIHQQPISGKSQMTPLYAIWEVNLCITILGSKSWSRPIRNMGGPVTSPLVSISGLNHHFLFNGAPLSTLCGAVDPQINRTICVQLRQCALCRFCTWPIDLLEIKSVRHISSLAAFDVLSTFEPHFAM